MGDSGNDDYDRRRSGKFRNERVNYRDDLNDRHNRKRREYRDYDRTSPKLKRLRRDWDDRKAPNQHRSPPNNIKSFQHKNGGTHGNIPSQSTSMMTFKQFLMSQDDAISDREAVKKYGEYKLQFSRQRVNEYFRSHKTEEWFKFKYHPEECAKRLADETNGVQKRFKVFMELVDLNMTDVALDIGQSDGIIDVLSASDCELNDVRIEPVGGIISDQRVVRADINFAEKIIRNLDSRYELWTEFKNPILTDITLVEKMDFGQNETETLDRLVLYLRVVHSVDYYNPNEMTNCVGVMHVRGPPASSEASGQEVGEYLAILERKIDRFLRPVIKLRLSDDEALKLGRKSRETEVEKFVRENTQELSKDKWLCPLSGKKFQNAEFVRKHIFNKHAERIEEVKTEVEFFNNYLVDPERPQSPERLSPTPQSRGNENQSEIYSGPTNYRQDSRKIVRYKDLDAPEDSGEFWSF